MANKEHLDILKKGTAIWNEWRKDHIDRIYFSEFGLSEVDLSGANLSGAFINGADLNGADLSGADLSGAFISGTDLNEANLNGADLSEANLNGADLSEANLSEADLRGAYASDETNLSNANLSNANLSNTKLRWVNLNGANLNGANLNGATLREANLGRANLSQASLIETNLTEADLTEADLTGANLSGAKLDSTNLTRANLREANLEGANLHLVQALSTNFTGAKLTDACLEDWHINSATKLDSIHCRYIYLKRKQQERRPRLGEFTPGQFSKLFQIALETVDLIFTDGIDWKAFFESFQQLQAEYGKDTLSVQAFERKSGKAFVVRLEVLPETNKAEIEYRIKELYEVKLNAIEQIYRSQLQAKDEQINVYHEQSANMISLAREMAARPIQMIIDVKATLESKSMSESYQSKYDQRNANNQFVDTAQSGSNVTFNQQNYTLEQKQNLAEATAEVQQILYQLAQTNPTSTEGLTEMVHYEVKRRPTLKIKLQAALKAGTLETLKAIFNHPLFNIPAETVKGWLEAE